MEKYGSKFISLCIIFGVFYKVVQAQSTADEAVISGCEQSILRRTFSHIACTDEKNNKINEDGLMKHGTSCIVKCKNNDISTYQVCNRGHWQGDDACELKIIPRTPHKHSRPKRWIRFRRIFRVFRAIGCLLTRCRRSPPPRPRDRTPPVLKCPSDITKVADPIQVNTKVYWVEPQAWDDRDGKVTTTRTGLGPGKLFSENRYNVIKYHARDKSGNMATCSFRITITVTRCSFLNRVNNGYYICHPSTDMRRGGRCRFGCYTGHELQGVSITTCADTGRWTGWSVVQPYCKKKTCQPLLPRLPLQRITCSDNYNFWSLCTFSCVPGYDIPSSSTSVLVCLSDQTWKGLQPQCVDTSPPVFDTNTCPYALRFYTDRGSTTGQVYWPDPTAVDNTGEIVNVLQKSGPTSGMRLSSGVYTVVYEAKDSAGNRAKDCVMKIVVKHILCFDIYPTPNTLVSCPAGTGYGQTCKFDCSGGAVLNGTAVISCEKTGNPPYGRWTWDNYQPFCHFQETCHALKAPANGALACDNWYGGRYCHPLCQEGYDVSPRPGVHFPNVVVCGDSGKWSTDIEFSDCLVARGSRKTKTALYFYYDGECSNTSTQMEIKQKFIEAFLDTGFKDYCLVTPECSYQNVVVLCGSTGRKRSTPQIEIRLEMQHTYTEDITEQTYNEHNNKLSKFLETTQVEIKDGKYDITLTPATKLPLSSMKSSSMDINCENNTVPSYRSFKCAYCAAGTYYSQINETSAACMPCPRGYYQPLKSQASCLLCPAGQSTRQEQSVSKSLCEDACPPGTWSSSSLPPCTQCPIGSYQGNYGATNCTSCPGGSITQDEGADSVNKCQEFDIVFPKDSSGTLLMPIILFKKDSKTIQTYYIAFRMSCTRQCLGDVLNLLDETGSSIFNLTINEQLIIIYKGISNYTDFRPTADQWYGYVVEVTTTVCNVYVDGRLKSSFSMVSDSIGPKTNFSVGGNGFAGSISQLNVFSNIYGIEKVKQFSSKCNNPDKGDWLSWSDIQKSDLKKGYIQLPAQCDDVNDCLSSPCIHGNCTDRINSYICDCHGGYTGVKCVENIDDCIAHSCQNNADCLDGVQSYTCICKDGFTGKYCEIAFVNGGWAEWGNWSECSVSCGNGTRSKVRTCSNPSPDNGGQECIGDNEMTESCNTEACPTCNPEILNSKVENGIFNCTKNSTIDLYVCLLQCDDDYDFDHAPPDNYTCGNATFYLWDFQTDDNPYGRLPQCVPIKAPTQINVTHTALYESLSCTADNAEKTKQSVQNTVSTAVETLSCIKSKTCSKGSTQVSNCGTTRRKRDTSSITETAGFDLQLLCNSQTFGTAECYSILTTAIQEILGMESAGQLTTQIDSTDYLILANSSSSNDEITCPANTVEVYMYCVPCGKGRYHIVGECRLCSIGSYQDEIQQNSCKNCSEGLTTNGTGSVSIDDCNVKVAVTVSNSSDSNAILDYLDDTAKIIAGTLVGVVLFTVVIIVGFIRLRKYFRNKSRSDKGSSFSLNMVRPVPKVAFVLPDVTSSSAKEHFDVNRLDSNTKYL